MSQKKILRIISLSTLAVLLISFLFDNTGRIVAAVIMAAVCALMVFLIKKRGIPNYMYSEVAMVVAVIAAVYVMLYYVMGIGFGFVKSNYGEAMKVILQYILPVSAIIVCSEVVRTIVRAQEDRFAGVITYVSCVIAEVIIHYTLSDIFTFRRFMDIIALAFLPAVLSNLLYHYLAKRYGSLPNIAYRLIITLYPYVIPYNTGIPHSLLSFINLILPLLVYLFIDYLYEKKKRYALARFSKLGVALTTVIVIMMTSIIMLVSNVFQFGAYVIATESMTGELNKGDIAIYERYDDDDTVQKGDIIVFKSGNKNVIHRVVDIAHINGETRYFTKGDANEDLDVGYITESDIEGIVELKLPYFGYPTLWLRELVNEIL